VFLSVGKQISTPVFHRVLKTGGKTIGKCLVGNDPVKKCPVGNALVKRWIPIVSVKKRKEEMFIRG
jgi:hypothetical protein